MRHSSEDVEREMSSMTDFKVAVVGAGKMGGAVLRAMVEKGGWPPASIGASDRDKGRLTQLQEELGIVAFQDNREACFWAEAL
ncbi:MAG: NAD(P)-binding domain-containing protein, partial [Candidatus Hadarchaeum sp.]